MFSILFQIPHARHHWKRMVSNGISTTIQWYLACLIWKKNALDMVDQSYGGFEFTTWATTQLE
jgi:hypothetical protein